MPTITSMRPSIGIGAMVLMLVLTGCSSTTLIRPLERGQWAVGANVGGPMIAFKGAAVPVPLSGVLVARGFADSATAFARVHATSAAFGVVHLELGGLKEWKAPAKWRPGFSAAPSLHVMLDTWKCRTSLYPQVDLNMYCFVGDGRGTKPPDLLHAGICNWFELRSTGAEGRAQRRHWLPAIHLGYTMARPKWNYTIESKWIAPFTSNEKLVVDYISPGSRGALGLYLSTTRLF